MKLEQWDTTTDLLEWSNAKSEKPFTSKDEGQQELSFVVSGNAIWKQYLTALNVVIPHDLIIMLLDSSANDLIATAHTKTCTWVLLQLNSYYHSLPHTHTHTHKLEATKVSFNRRLDKQTTVHQHKRILFKNKKKWTIKSQKEMDETWINVIK